MTTQIGCVVRAAQYQDVNTWWRLSETTSLASLFNDDSVVGGQLAAHSIDEVQLALTRELALVRAADGAGGRKRRNSVFRPSFIQGRGLLCPCMWEQAVERFFCRVTRSPLPRMSL